MQTVAPALPPKLRRMFYYKAAPVARVSPFVIPQRMEVIEIVTSGVVYFHDGERDRELGCGALFWHLPGEETICRTDPRFPYECLAVGFRSLTDPVRTVPRLSIISDPLRAKELCSELFRAFHNDAVDRAVLGDYARHRFLWEAHLGTIKATAVPRPLSLEEALGFLETEFRRPEIGVADLARAAGLSEPRLHVLFREYLRQTPYHLLIARRIQEAKWLLTGTSRNIKTLCEECGFANVETFYRAFKKHAGMPPHRFRACYTLSANTGYSSALLKNDP